MCDLESVVDYLHTVVLFVILYIFAFKIYGTSDAVGSPGRMWDLLQQAAELVPVEGNAEGSYTTMKSNGGILFAGCEPSSRSHTRLRAHSPHLLAGTIASGFSGVVVDQGYWHV